MSETAVARYEVEVIVIDDASTDLTPHLAATMPIALSKVNRNRGKAAAINLHAPLFLLHQKFGLDWFSFEPFWLERRHRLKTWHD